MRDLTDEELESIERSLGGPQQVASSNSETARMVAELRRHRSAVCRGCDGDAERLYGDGAMHACTLCSGTGIAPLYIDERRALDDLRTAHEALLARLDAYVKERQKMGRGSVNWAIAQDILETVIKAPG